MRTAILSIAALASGVLAAPGWQGRGSNFGGNWGANDNSWGNKPEGYGPGTGSWGQSSSASSSAISSSKAVESTSSVAVAPVTGVSSSKAVSSATEVSSTSSKAVSSATGASSSSKAVSSANGVSSSSSKAESSTILSTSVSTKPSSSPTVPGSLTFSFSKNATSSIATASTGSAPGKVTKTTTLSETLTTYTTEVITKYTTICPVTSTHITGGSTATTTFLTTSTVTATQTATITSKVSSSPASGPSSLTKSGAVSSSSVAVSPESSSTVKTTVTDVTTIYTTVCPVTTTSVSGSSTLTSTFTTTSTVTSVTHKTITLTVPVGPSGSASGSASSGSASATTPVSPVTVSSAEHSGSASATVPNSPAITSPSGPGASSSSLSGSDVTVTDVTTVFTTVCPATTTVTNGHSTLTSTFLTTSTVTSVIKSTITLTSVSTVSPFVSTVQWGTQLLSYSVTDAITFPTSTPTTPVGPASYSRNTNSTAVGGASGTGHHKKPTSKGTSVSGKPKSTSSAKGTSASSKSTLSAVPTGSVTSKSVLSSATGSVTSKSIFSSATGSVSSKSVLPSGTGSVSSKPAVTGTGSISSKSVITSTKTSSSTTSTASSKPSESCIPCEGQPGNDPNTFCGLTINDNSYKVIPKTCKTVEYDFVITNTTFAPDGVSRLGLLVNGQMPGPKIEANWGDTIVVRVHNQLQNNGTAIHFHGQRQNYTNEMDGVPSITQCPLAPGEVQTYKFKADNYGTSWWHSHYALQIYDGVFGPMVIHGPASATYDEEQFITLQDWNHVPVDALYDISQTVGNAPGNGPQTLDTGLINGLNVFGSGGSRFNMNVESGKTYRLRLLNSAIQTTFKFYLDGHKFQVIANDYVPIKPYTTTIVNINPGQRYDVIFKADQPVGNYWLRADAQQTCTALKNAKDIKAIVSYKGAASGSPTSTAYTYTEECVDEPLASLVPVYNVPAGSQEQNIHETVLIGGNGGTPNLYKWTLSGTTFQSQYGDPTLVSIYNNGTIPAYSGNLAIEVPKLGEWVYVIIESPIPVPHPIHLHGHDFLVLAQGYGSYSSSVKLNTATPARRDSALLPGNRGQGGYLVVAFETDNPGAWLMHCHIGWHSAMGFALQIIENLGGISEWVTEGEALNDQCTNWSAFAAKDNVRVLDSGI